MEKEDACGFLQQRLDGRSSYKLTLKKKKKAFHHILSVHSDCSCAFLSFDEKSDAFFVRCTTKSGQAPSLSRSVSVIKHDFYGPWTLDIGHWTLDADLKTKNTNE